jgi:hypothetical protein
VYLKWQSSINELSKYWLPKKVALVSYYDMSLDMVNTQIGDIGEMLITKKSSNMGGSNIITNM